jgi:hypothetical protein
MKKFILSTVMALTLMANSALADGQTPIYEEPEVMAPRNGLTKGEVIALVVLGALVFGQINGNNDNCTTETPQPTPDPCR